MATDHRKYFNADGELIPSATTVLKLFHKDLTGWANWLGFKRINVAEYVREKANFGTYIHYLAEAYFKGEKVDTIDARFISEKTYKDYLAKFKYIQDTLSDKGYDYYGSEIGLEGKKYGGTIDLVFRNKQTDECIVLDFKTSKAIQPTMFMQLGAYAQLLEECTGMKTSHVGIILITRYPNDEGFSNIISSTENRNNTEIFNHLVDIYYLLDDKSKQNLH